MDKLFTEETYIVCLLGLACQSAPTQISLGSCSQASLAQTLSSPVKAYLEQKDSDKETRLVCLTNIIGVCTWCWTHAALVGFVCAALAQHRAAAQSLCHYRSATQSVK